MNYVTPNTRGLGGRKAQRGRDAAGEAARSPSSRNARGGAAKACGGRAAKAEAARRSLRLAPGWPGSKACRAPVTPGGATLSASRIGAGHGAVPRPRPSRQNRACGSRVDADFPRAPQVGVDFRAESAPIPRRCGQNRRRRALAPWPASLPPVPRRRAAAPAAASAAPATALTLCQKLAIVLSIHPFGGDLSWLPYHSPPKKPKNSPNKLGRLRPPLPHRWMLPHRWKRSRSLPCSSFPR